MTNASTGCSRAFGIIRGCSSLDGTPMDQSCSWPSLQGSSNQPSERPQRFRRAAKRGEQPVRVSSLSLGPHSRLAAILELDVDRVWPAVHGTILDELLFRCLPLLFTTVSPTLTVVINSSSI